jgi:hypothetical protein
VDFILLMDFHGLERFGEPFCISCLNEHNSNFGFIHPPGGL